MMKLLNFLIRIPIMKITTNKKFLSVCYLEFVFVKNISYIVSHTVSPFDLIVYKLKTVTTR